MTTITHFSHPEHPLIQKEEGFVPENKALCYGCDRPIWKGAVYSCTVCENWFLHDFCAEFSTHITHLKHTQHLLILVPRMPSLNACRICGSKSKVFAYRCNPCDFDVCLVCVYRYPEHQLCLHEDVVIGKDVLCDGCHEPLTTSTFYTSSTKSGKKYYLHRTCVELPPKINHPSHPDCDLLLNLILPSDRSCDLCFRLRATFTCTPCGYDVCAKCAFKDRVIIHEGHKHHSLTFRYQQALFHCHACRERAEDSSYTCNICDFWIHESCASAPTTISATTYHHHPLHLVYCIPDIHLNFDRFCGLCKKFVAPRRWVYYCHRCTYFVHMRCATTWIRTGETMIKEIEGDCANDDPNLVQFPLATEETLFDLLIHQFRKSQIDFKEVSSTSSLVPEDPPNYVNGWHWSHADHPLQELHLSTFKEEEYDRDDEERLMVCDGCIQPISDAYPSFYGCIQCGFFLHKFCASTLPSELPAGASPFHPQHSLFLHKMDKFYYRITCGSCNFATNGFFYQCKTCNIYLDVHCTFLPCSIKFEAQKSHSLVQCAASGSECSISKLNITAGFEYGCGTCSNFHIRKSCIFYPSRMKHRLDSHTVTLRYPPFFYEGVFYCQICEEQVDNNRWLYHCDDCDQSFHSECLRPLNNVKLGQNIVVGIDNQKHTLTFVLKALKRKGSAPYICKSCGDAFRSSLALECAGCGYLVCVYCFRNRIQME